MDEKLPPPSPEHQHHHDPHEKEQVSRRKFLMNVGLALNGLVGLILAVPLVGYILGPVLKRKDYLSWVDLGDVSSFQLGETRLVSFTNPFRSDTDGETAKIPAYVRTVSPGQFTVFAVNCAHLGCPVRWFSESQLFMCPCHGGVYYADGSRASGPPERGLFEYQTKVQNNHLWIEAGQIPTLSNRASATPCPSAGKPAPTPALVTLSVEKRTDPCPGTNEPTIG